MSMPPVMTATICYDCAVIHMNIWTCDCAGEPGNLQAVLMDFGSTREAHVEVKSRTEAVKLQEDAEAHCSAPYRQEKVFYSTVDCESRR